MANGKMCATNIANDKYLATIQAAQTNSESSMIFVIVRLGVSSLSAKHVFTYSIPF